MGKKVNAGESKPGAAKKSSSASSKRWMQEHVSDFYVKEANKKGLRSRAVFKLEEINKKDKLISYVPGFKLSGRECKYTKIGPQSSCIRPLFSGLLLGTGYWVLGTYRRVL